MSMLLSPETLRGLYITGEVYTFCVLWLSMYIIFLIIQCTRLWSWHNTFSQCLGWIPSLAENFLGCVRQRGGAHANPNAVEFLNNTQVLRVVNTCKPVARGNCRGNNMECDGPAEQENIPLPRRKKIKLNWFLCSVLFL